MEGVDKCDACAPHERGECSTLRRRQVATATHLLLVTILAGGGAAAAGAGPEAHPVQAASAGGSKLGGKEWGTSWDGWRRVEKGVGKGAAQAASEACGILPITTYRA